MIPRYNNHFRTIQKNLFLGEERVLFANPNNPDDPTGPQAVEAQFPDNQQRAEAKESKLANAIRKMVPSRLKYNEEDAASREQIRERLRNSRAENPDEWTDAERGRAGRQADVPYLDWNEMMGEYNGIQSRIDYLLGEVDYVSQPDFDPRKRRYAERYKRIYGNLVRLEEMRIAGQPLDVDFDDLRTKLQSEVSQQTETIVEDIQAVIRKLIEARNRTAAAIQENLLEDFGERVLWLRNQWEHHPPANFEEAAPGWIENCDKLWEHLEGLPPMQSDDPHFPEGTKLTQRFEEYWALLDQMEDSYDIFRKGQEHDLDITKLENKFHGLEAIRQEKLTEEFDKKYNTKIDQTVASLDKAIRVLQARADKENDKEKKEEVLKQVTGIQATRANILERKNPSEHFDELLNSEDQLNGIVKGNTIQIMATRDGKDMHITKGLRGQIELIKNTPFSEAERRQMMFRMNEALDMAEKHMNTMDDDINVEFTTLQQKAELVYQDETRAEGTGKIKIMWLKPVPTGEHMWHTISSLWTRSYERDSKRAAGVFGREATKFLEGGIVKRLGGEFEPLRPLSEMSREADNEREHAEHEGFSHYEKALEHADVSHITHVMHSTTNIWEFRGLVGLLCKKGRMRWDDPEVFRQLNRFQSSIVVPTNRYWHLENPSLSDEVMRKAVVAMYQDPDVYRDWRNQNSSAIESKKGEFSKRWGQLSELPGGLRSYIKGLLTNHINDPEHADVDPNEYESIITYGIEQGKMSPEDKLFYLIQGIASGLLAPDRGSEMTRFNNQYPCIEYFASPTQRGSRPTLMDLKEVAAMKYPLFCDWFHSYVMTLPKVTQRVDKALTGGIKLDHDDFTPFAGYMSAQTAKTLLSARADGGYSLPATGAQNGTVGLVFYMDTLAEHYGEMGAEGQLSLSRFVNSFMVFDGILMNRMYANRDGYFRLDYNSKNSEPRSSENYEEAYGRGKGMTTQKNLDYVRSKLITCMDFDPQFSIFKNLSSGAYVGNDAKVLADAQGLMGKYDGIFGKGAQAPKNADELYMLLGDYTNYVIRYHSHRIEALFAEIRQEHSQAYAFAESKEKGSSLQAQKAKYAHDREILAKEFEELARKGGTEAPHGHGGHGAHGHGAHGGHGEHDDHGAHGGGHGADEHPTEGHGANNGQHFGGAAAAHGQAVHGSTHGQHRHAA